jgi:hypothetical protein
MDEVTKVDGGEREAEVVETTEVTVVILKKGAV